jgi:hypothetical protein
MNKLQSLKCVEVTSQRQADNGTICYHDPITNCDYLSYESGYIRRSYKTKLLSSTARSYYGGKFHETIYQLNPKRKGYYKSEYTGKIYETTARVMIQDPKERMDRLASAVVNYRNTKKNNQSN